MSLKSKIQSLISAGNDVTGLDDPTLTDVVQSLIDGYGQAGTRYTIVWNLSKVTSTSSRSRIPEGQSLTATLSAETGYSMTSVVVLMGGVDITSTAYSNGQISIASVTGNVIISASAETTLSYSSFKGFVTPFNGAYNDWMYDKMIPVGNKIYMNYCYMQSHYNSTGESKKSVLLCYDTETETVEWERTCICDGVIFNSQIMKLIDGKLYIWNGDGYRYESSNWGQTWTKTACTGMSSDYHYAIVTSTGRIIASAPGSSTHNYLYSDDVGLTWSTISNPFGSTTYVTSHNCFYEEDGKIVVYLFAPMYTNNTQNATRYVSYSEDNGATWTTPVACTGDLASAGSSYMTGQIIKFGGEYHYITAVRYYDSSDTTGGRLEWYKGTFAELLSGTLTLVKTIYKNYGFSRIDDTGNMGACACNGAIYVNVAGLLVVPGGASTSNQGIRLFKLTKEQEADAVVPEMNENFKAIYDALLVGQSTSPRYYLYNGETDVSVEHSRAYGGSIPTPIINFGDVDFNIMGKFATAYMPNVPILRYEVDNKDFEVNAVVGAFYDAQFGQTERKLFVLIGFEKADGTIHAFIHGSSYSAVLNTADTSGIASGMLGGQTSQEKKYVCITFKRVNGDLYLSVDGVTIKNPIYSNVQDNSRFQSQLGKDNIFISFIGNDGDTSLYDTWYETGIANTTSSYSGIRLLTIDY